jgi:hypothetical protein
MVVGLFFFKMPVASGAFVGEMFLHHHCKTLCGGMAVVCLQRSLFATLLLAIAIVSEDLNSMCRCHRIYMFIQVNVEIVHSLNCKICKVSVPSPAPAPLPLDHAIDAIMGGRAGVCLRGDDEGFDDDTLEHRSPVTQKNCSALVTEKDDGTEFGIFLQAEIEKTKTKQETSGNTYVDG